MMLFFATILYVDDTNLLLCAGHPETPDCEFFQKIQLTLSTWARITLVTGGDPKAAKCHASIITFSFVNGKARLNKKPSLRHVSLTISQKAGPYKVVALIKPTESRKNLGVLNNIVGSGVAHLKYVRADGLDWANKLNTNKYINPSDSLEEFDNSLETQTHVGYCLPHNQAQRRPEGKHLHSPQVNSLRVYCSIHRKFRTMP
jgi:hypothetical protein